MFKVKAIKATSIQASNSTTMQMNLLRESRATRKTMQVQVTYFLLLRI